MSVDFNDKLLYNISVTPLYSTSSGIICSKEVITGDDQGFQHGDDDLKENVKQTKWYKCNAEGNKSSFTIACYKCDENMCVTCIYPFGLVSDTQNQFISIYRTDLGENHLRCKYVDPTEKDDINICKVGEVHETGCKL